MIQKELVFEVSYLDNFGPLDVLGEMGMQNRIFNSSLPLIIRPGVKETPFSTFDSICRNIFSFRLKLRTDPVMEGEGWS